MEAILNLFYLCILFMFCCYCKAILLNTFWREISVLISILEQFSFCHYIVKIILQDYFNSVFCFKITGLK